jgi:hypothetical protein
VKRYPIEIVDGKRMHRSLEDKALVSRKAYLGILALARKTWVWDEVAPQIELTCEKCGSFALGFVLACQAIEDLRDHFSEASPRSYLLQRLIETLAAVYDDLAGWVDPDNFDSEEVAIILDPECSCYPYLVGEPKEKKPEEDPFDPLGPGDSVKMYVGPRLKW